MPTQEQSLHKYAKRSECSSQEVGLLKNNYTETNDVSKILTVMEVHESLPFPDPNETNQWRDKEEAATHVYMYIHSQSSSGHNSTRHRHYLHADNIIPINQSINQSIIKRNNVGTIS